MKSHVFEALLSLQDEKIRISILEFLLNDQSPSIELTNRGKFLQGFYIVKSKSPVQIHTVEIHTQIFFENLKVSNTVQVQTPYMDFSRKSQSLQYRAHTGHMKQSPSTCLQGPHTQGKHKFQSPQYRHSSDESLQHRKIRTDAGVKFRV